jgi:hypothetical protein
VKPLRVQISTLMIIVVFIALNLGAVRPSIFNRWGALPMANVLLVGLVAGRRYRGIGRFLWGFEALGTMALAIYITLAHLIPFQIATRYTNMAVGPYLDMRGHRLTAMNHLELDAIVMAMLGLPQLAVAITGGVLTSCMLPAAVNEESMMRQRRLMWTAVGVLAITTAAGLWGASRALSSVADVTTATVYSSSMDVSGYSPSSGKIALTAIATSNLPFPSKRWFTVEVRDLSRALSVWTYAFNDLRHTMWAPVGKQLTSRLDETLPIDLLPGAYQVYVEYHENIPIGDRAGNILKPSNVLCGRTTDVIEVR